NGHQEYVPKLVLIGGQVTAPGAGFLGLFNNVGVITTNSSSTTATISGNLNLNCDSAHPVQFNIGTGTTPSGIDLDVSAVVSSGAIAKNGAGTLRLSGASNFSGGLTLSAGTLLVGDNSALGSGPLTFAGGTIQA